jgi:hypothetical protein
MVAVRELHKADPKLKLTTYPVNDTSLKDTEKMSVSAGIGAP